MSTPDYTGKKILFTAFSIADGSEELAGYEYVKQHGATSITTFYWGNDAYAEKIPADINKIKIQGNNLFDPSLTKGYDIVFRHQTTRPELILSPTTTNTNEFFKYCKLPIIAVTGTKGKGTTTTLISKILEQADIANRLLGNMGNTAIRELDDLHDDEIVVFEISSFQLWDLQYSPQVAVVLMMDIDHQDIHSSVAEYMEAKSHITRFQTGDDLVVYHPENAMTATVVGKPKGRKKRYLTDDGAHIVDGKIIIDKTEIMPADQVCLKGKHNLENVCAAITAAWEFTRDVTAISNAVANFSGLEHRLEFVRTLNEIEFYNDSFSATPVAAIAAVQAFQQPIVVILGGYEKNADFTNLARAVAAANVVKAVVIGEVQEKIIEALNKVQFDNIVAFKGESMKDIVTTAIRDIPDQAVVLLSPGCASFDMFANYKDRGNQFKSVIRAL